MPAPNPNDEQIPPPAGSGAEEQTQVRIQDSTVLVRPDGTPTILGYELSREIARGGMGVVYAARELALDRPVAVKVMLPNMLDAEFVRESRIAARLPHPGIPPVHALGVLGDGRPFLAMKLVEGETLDTLLRARTAPGANRARFVVVFEQMCQAVGYAHSRGIVHRDLKPSNVMVGNFGEVQVMDWGLAREARSEECDSAPEPSVVPNPALCAPPSDEVSHSAPRFVETVAGQVKGTPAYMAPEQARGERVDARADVFALGGILAVMLTGKPPFAGNSALDTIVRASRPNCPTSCPNWKGAGAEIELVALAKRCLAARAEDRPANGREVAEAVAAYRIGGDARLQRAERDRAAAEARAAEEVNTRREAEARTAAERAKSAEHRKRRLVQLALGRGAAAGGDRCRRRREPGAEAARGRPTGRREETGGRPPGGGAEAARSRLEGRGRGGASDAAADTGRCAGADTRVGRNRECAAPGERLERVPRPDRGEVAGTGGSPGEYQARTARPTGSAVR